MRLVVWMLLSTSSISMRSRNLQQTVPNISSVNKTALSMIGHQATCSELAKRRLCEFVNDLCPIDCAGASTACVAGLEWNGRSCADVNECASSPCHNFGQCVESSVREYISLDHFACICLPGYTGTLCATDEDECHSFPCHHGAHCNDLANQYTCDCISGYQGDNCQEDTDECESNPCRNGGTCVLVPGGAALGVYSYRCLCARGYDGSDCEHDIDECSSQPCRNGGLCIPGMSQFTCICPSNFAGIDCGNLVDPCDFGEQCHGHGDCFSQTGSGASGTGAVHCVCDFGWSGRNCQRILDPNERSALAPAVPVSGCARAAEGMFQCNARSYGCNYVPLSYVNDGKFDCPDGSDEPNIASQQGSGIPIVRAASTPTNNEVSTQLRTDSTAFTQPLSADPCDSQPCTQSGDVKATCSSTGIGGDVFW
eukprot:SAG31_NODE_852_length_11515_cov_6.636125_7_plen_425_part_00